MLLSLSYLCCIDIACITESVARCRRELMFSNYGSIAVVIRCAFVYVADFEFVADTGCGSSISPVTVFAVIAFYVAGWSVSSSVAVRRCRQLRVRRCRLLWVRRCHRLRVVNIASYRFRCHCFYVAGWSVSSVAVRRSRRLWVRRCRLLWVRRCHRLRVVDIAGYRFCSRCFYVAGSSVSSVARFRRCRRLPVSQSRLYVSWISRCRRFQVCLYSSLSLVAGSSL